MTKITIFNRTTMRKIDTKNRMQLRGKKLDSEWELGWGEIHTSTPESRLIINLHILVLAIVLSLFSLCWGNEFLHWVTNITKVKVEHTTHRRLKRIKWAHFNGTVVAGTRLVVIVGNLSPSSEMCLREWVEVETFSNCLTSPPFPPWLDLQCLNYYAQPPLAPFLSFFL